jgi:hypothetical protein
MCIRIVRFERSTYDVLITAALVGRYEFGTFPPDNPPAEDLNKNGAKFQNGFFTSEGKRHNITELAIFNDGLVVNSNSTEGATAFLDDLTNFVRSTFKFRDFTSKVRKLLVSQLTVEFDTRLAALVPLFEKIVGLINEETSQNYQTPSSMDFGRIDFLFDKERARLDYASPRFLIERRLNIPFSQERYYCSATMDTGSHLRILGEIEKMLLA